MRHDKDKLPSLPLPKKWAWTRLKDFSFIIQGQSPPSSTYNQNGNGLPFYQGKAEFGVLYPTPQNWCVAPKKVAEKGDVLISVRAPVGPTNICPDKSCIGRGLAAIRGLGGIDTFFILYLLRAFERVLAEKGTGTTFNAITGDTLRNLVIPLLPLPEQKRIVAKIEELFTRLDAGVEALKKVKAEIKRYRQAVLKHAFEGRLTGEWRKNVGATLAVAPDKGAGISPAPTENLPEGWVWVRVGDICDLINGRAFKPSEWAAKGLPIIRIQNLNNVKANFNYCDFKVDEKYLVNNGQLLFAWSGTPGTSFGAHIWKAGKAVLNQHIFKVGIDEAHINKVFLMYLLNRNVDEYIRKAHGTAGLAHITKGKFENSAILLPPLTEQHKIVEEIERRFSIADEVEATIDQSLKQAQRLRQSILKRAFEGRLVPQDPTDEPASALLERIRLNRESKKGIKTGRRKPRGEKSAGMA